VHGAAQGSSARRKADERTRDEYRDRLYEIADKAISGIERILENPEDDKVLLAASKDVLDRVGLGAVQKNLNLNADVDAGVNVDDEIEGLVVRVVEKRKEERSA
jgi:hypothetical protein